MIPRTIRLVGKRPNRRRFWRSNWAKWAMDLVNWCFYQGGRIEEFVPNRNLKSEDLDDWTIVEQIARKVAMYHGMHKVVPTTQLPRDASVTVRKNTTTWNQLWLIEALEKHLDKDYLALIDAKLIRRFDFNVELEAVSVLRAKIESPLIHAHYDLNCGNILVRDKADRHGHRVMLVDYEGACMERRGFDLGTHFNFVMVDISKSGNLSGRGYASFQYRRFFAEKYLDEWAKENGLDPKLDTVEHIVLETDVDSLMHALFLLSFWLVPDERVLKSSYLPKFVSMGMAMLASYFKRKEQLVLTLYK